MQANIIYSAIKRRKHSQVLMIDSNPSGFRIIRADKAKDSDYLSYDFVGVFGQNVSISIIEKELKFTEDIRNANKLTEIRP